jgi:hypothetical protein
VADARAAFPVTGGIVVDLAAGEFDDGACVVEALEVADEGKREGVIEGGVPPI